MPETLTPAPEFGSRLNHLSVRYEYLVVLLVAVGLTVVHWREINWYAFVGLFLYIDVIGYIPGLIRTRQLRSGRVNRSYYLAYNLTHSLLTAVPVALAVGALVGAPWSALAVVVHLAGDRGLLDNWMKPPSGDFEHVAPAGKPAHALQ